MIKNSTTGFLPVVVECRSELITAGLCPHVAEDMLSPLYQLGQSYLKFRTLLNIYGQALPNMNESAPHAALDPVGIHSRRLIANMFGDVMPRLPTLNMASQFMTECATVVNQLAADNMMCQQLFQVEISEIGDRFSIEVRPRSWVDTKSYNHKITPMDGKLEAFTKGLEFKTASMSLRNAIKQMVEHQRK